MAIEKLTYLQVQNAKPKDKDYSLSDGGGLRLIVKRNGTRLWWFNYRYFGKQKTLSLGVYPDVELTRARELHREARKLLSQDIDPASHKQEQKLRKEFESKNTFACIALSWWENKKGKWTDAHAERILKRLTDNAFPLIGRLPITAIKPKDIKAVRISIEKRDALDVARRVINDINRVCSWAVVEGLIEHNPAAELPGTVKERQVEHRPSLPREELPQFLRDLEQYTLRGRLLTKLAIDLLVLTFVRSTELRGARWEEFDLDNRLWRIPASRMKMKTEHIVPLSDQAIKTLDLLKQISGQGELVFPSEKRNTEYMSDNTMRLAIFRMGYDGNTPGKSKCVPHGFRATASSILNESGFNPDAVERQLSHMERNGVRAAYTHHARYLEDRRTMMQWWADYLDDLKNNGKVVPIFAKQN